MSNNDYDDFLKELQIYLDKNYNDNVENNKIFEKESREENISLEDKTIKEVNSVKNIGYRDVKTFTT